MTAKKQKTISGFSKLSKRGKIKWLVENFFKDPEAVMKELMSYWHSNEKQQEILDGFSENTISNYPMPYSVAPNFVIDDRPYVVPMVIEESSVVAAASAAAKFWMDRGGFKTEILGTEKRGQVHFLWKGSPNQLDEIKEKLEAQLHADVNHLTKNMRARGGGIQRMEWLNKSDIAPDFYQLMVTFETCDSMGANFINSCLEQFALSLEKDLSPLADYETVMSILSNYTPQCVVRAQVSCPIEDLGSFGDGMSAEDFARRFQLAVEIARQDIYRATTHNKGIFNGVDAVVLATGNDFRAIEACAHTYAARDGQYRSLSQCTLDNGVFRFWLDLPLAVGTVGGLTALHPIAKRSLELLEFPSATELMRIIAATGLAQNFAAVRSLVTTGIQKGHMKMHLHNILNQLEATEDQKARALAYFEDKVVSFSAVRDYLEGEVAQ